MDSLTTKNVFINRARFEKLCKNANACKDSYAHLLRAKTEQEFLDVIFSNAKWVSENIADFKFNENLDIVSVKNFNSDKITMAKLSNGNFIFIDKSGNPIKNRVFEDVKRYGYSKLFKAKSKAEYFFIYCNNGIMRNVSEQEFVSDKLNFVF